jgi:putative hemolysin
LDIDAPIRLYLIFFLFWALVFFTASESSLFSLGRLGLQKLGEEGHPRFPLLEELLKRPRRLIISLLIGNEAANVAISSLTSALFISLWGDGAKWLAIPVVVMGILLFGELIPKTLAVRHPEKIAPLVAYPVERFLKLVGPLHWVIRKVVDGIFKLARIRLEPSRGHLTEAYFKELVEASQRDGALEEGEKHLIHRVFKLGDQTARDILTPRSAIFALPLSAQLQEAIHILKERRFSRVPIYRRDLDEIVGILYAKDLLGDGGRKKFEEEGLGAILRKPHFVPPGKKLDVLFKELQRRRIHLAVVVDEYGKTAGLVTLEDILEELFGEIYDEHDWERNGGKQGAQRKRRLFRRMGIGS